jgi:hypothetical protein
VFRAYQLAKNDYSFTENKHRLTKPCPPSNRASSSLELSGTSMVKNLHEESSNSCKNGTNGSSMSKNPWLGFYGTSIGQTMKKLGLLHFSPSSFAGTGSTKRTSVCINLEHVPKRAFKPSTKQF